MPKRKFGSSGYSTLLLHSVWTSFFDRCLIKLPTSEYVSPQFGGSWTLESSSLCHHPTVIIALNRTIRDGSSCVSCLTPIPEEWLVEKDWLIVNHWEDQFCRPLSHGWSLPMPSAYQDECTVFYSPFGTSIQERCPLTRQIHACCGMSHPSYSPSCPRFHVGTFAPLRASAPMDVEDIGMEALQRIFLPQGNVKSLD